MTTHYRPWREKFRWGWLKPDRPCQFIELSRWEREAGIRTIGSLPEVGRLKSLLAEEAVDWQSVCIKGGGIIEGGRDDPTKKKESSVACPPDAGFT